MRYFTVVFDASLLVAQVDRAQDLEVLIERSSDSAVTKNFSTAGLFRKRPSRRSAAWYPWIAPRVLLPPRSQLEAANMSFSKAVVSS